MRQTTVLRRLARMRAVAIRVLPTPGLPWSSRPRGGVTPSYRPGVKWGTLDGCLPEFVTEAMREALPLLERDELKATVAVIGSCSEQYAASTVP